MNATAPTRGAYAELAIVASALVVSAGVLLVLLLIGALHVVGKSAPYAQWMIIVGAAQVMADCSLVGIWWARSNWPSHAKTLLAVLCYAALWFLLILLLDSVDFHHVASAGWVVALFLQLFGCGLVVSLLDRVISPAVSRPRRYSLLFLFLWTSLVAAMLGAGRQIAERLNWSASAIIGWEYFLHLLVIGVGNALLAAALTAMLQLTSEWPRRALVGALLGLGFSLLMPQVMQWSFQDAGAPWGEMFALLAAESGFLICALAPMQVARDARSARYPHPGLLPRGEGDITA